MEPKYDHKKVEEKIYRMWEEGGYFSPEGNQPKKTLPAGRKAFTIILPPPNASGKMHTGNVLMIAIEDVLIRWHRMKGDPTLWVPGTDHAGTETQITFERELKKQGKSRFDYDRNSLYQEIWGFVERNNGLIESQIREMGASVDWTRYKFTLDPDVVSLVQTTFKKMAKEGLIYRDDYMVNYCPVCGTTYADIEVSYVERKDPVYYMKYGPFTIATVRPESKFRDTALAANPKDKRYKDYIGKTLEITGLLGNITMSVIPDPEVDPEFGTGIMKVTPAHDPHDFALGKKFNLPVSPIIDLNGRMDFSWFLEKAGNNQKYRQRAEKYHGKKVLEARKLMIEDLKEDGLLVKTDETYGHSVPVCKAGHDIEPTILPNWFIKVDSLRKPALQIVQSRKVKIYPAWRKITYTRWMEAMHDWAISRQNVWGIRIPAWYDVTNNPELFVTFLDKEKKIISGRIGNLVSHHTLEEIENGLQILRASKDCTYVISADRPGKNYLQETDTFDTWFSSGQWPLATLGYPDSDDFKFFYPTSVMETGWEILSKWVSRMIMFGLYLTGEAPFQSVYLHGIVRALDGRKMSKSLGNVINPDEYMVEFGTDALRMGLISGTANGKDFNFPKDKIIAYRNFGNKLWNIGRFLLINFEGKEVPWLEEKMPGLDSKDLKILKSLKLLIQKTDQNLEKFRFAQAGEAIYQFVWHEFADIYLEQAKERIQNDDLVVLSVLRHIYLTSLKLLHPFMPFITEEIWQRLAQNDGQPLIVSSWPDPRLPAVNAE